MKAFWSRATRRVRRVRAAGREADWLLLAQMTAFGAAVPLLMRMKVPHLQRLLGRGRRHSDAEAVNTAAVLRHFTLARGVAAPLVGSGCLTRGLTLYYFLRRRGVDVNLTFGMARIDGRFIGHCWLARQGVPFLERDDPRQHYAPVFTMPLDPSIRTGAAFPATRDVVRS